MANVHEHPPAPATTPTPPPPAPAPAMDCSDEAIKKRGEEREKRRLEVLKEAQCILKEHGGLAANIPVSSAYWGLMNEFRSHPPAPVPTKNVTEPYRELLEKLAGIERAAHIRNEFGSEMAHYDSQHPATQAQVQMEIAKENEARAKEADKPKEAEK